MIVYGNVEDGKMVMMPIIVMRKKRDENSHGVG
jgi:hypothetical protein